MISNSVRGGYGWIGFIRSSWMFTGLETNEAYGRIVRVPDTVRSLAGVVDKLLPPLIVRSPPTVISPSMVAEEVPDTEKSPAMEQYFITSFTVELINCILLIVRVFVTPDPFSLPSMVT